MVTGVSAAMALTPHPGCAATPIVLVMGDHPVVVATWALVLFPLAWFTALGALVYTRRRQRWKRCPECAEEMRREVVRCRSCGHHFARWA